MSLEARIYSVLVISSSETLTKQCSDFCHPLSISRYILSPTSVKQSGILRKEALILLSSIHLCLMTTAYGLLLIAVGL